MSLLANTLDAIVARAGGNAGLDPGIQRGIRKLYALCHLSLCERGNALLVEDDRLAFYGRVVEDLWVIVTYIHGNYPSMNITTKVASEEQVVQEVLSACPSWLALKCNLPIGLTPDGCIPAS